VAGLLWVLRQTVGWNRQYARFTWYQIAKDLLLDRPTVYRAGSALLAAGILRAHAKHVAIQTDAVQWKKDLPGRARGKRQLWMPGLNISHSQRPALAGANDNVANQQQKRWQETTLFRRARDIKDRLKTYKTGPTLGVRQRFQNGAFREHPAGAAQPVSRKYDGLPQD
jgi:hypothetical protein